MSFKLIQLIVRWAIRFYYRTVHYFGENKLPENAPVIVAANHSNSALDAIFLSAFLSREIHWLARGDVYKNKLVARFMSFAHTAPIYRSTEFGIESIKKNLDSFEHCFRLLGKNKMVAMFPEGITVHKRMMQRPFKKGLARLALQAHEVIGKPIIIMPVGVSYRSLSMPRSQVFIHYGQSFSTELFFETFKQNEILGIKNFNEHIEKLLNNEIISYDLVENQNGLKLLIEINENEIYPNYSTPFGINHEEKLVESEHKLVQNLIDWQQKDLLKTEKLKELTSKYSQLLETTNSTDNGVKIGKNDSFVGLKSIIYKILSGMSTILYFLPNTIIKSLINSKVKKIEFYTSVRYSLSLIVFAIYSVGLALIIKLGIGFSFWMSLSAILLITYFGLKSQNLAHQKTLFKATSSSADELIAIRAQIVELIK